MPKARHAAPYVSRRRWTIRDARVALAALTASGLSPSAFAEREGLSAERLYRWRRQLAVQERRDAAAELIEIRPRRADPIEIVLVTGRILRVAETVDVSALARLIAALERP